MTTTGIGKKNFPKNPGIVKIGINATIVVNIANITGTETLLVPLIEASTFEILGFLFSVKILSPTIIASSTTIPKTKIKPKRDARFMLISKKGKKIKAPKNEIGIPSITKKASEGLKKRVKMINTNINPLIPFSMSILSLLFK